jgi:hypothetical protein
MLEEATTMNGAPVLFGNAGAAEDRVARAGGGSSGGGRVCTGAPWCAPTGGSRKKPGWQLLDEAAEVGRAYEWEMSVSRRARAGL